MCLMQLNIGLRSLARTAKRGPDTAALLQPNPLLTGLRRYLPPSPTLTKRAPPNRRSPKLVLQNFRIKSAGGNRHVDHSDLCREVAAILDRVVCAVLLHHVGRAAL
jgi:hypothetical protein